MVAASDGVITSAGMTPRGFAVTIDHGAPTGLTTYYARLAELLVPSTDKAPPGRRVLAGEPLGVVGYLADPNAAPPRPRGRVSGAMMVPVRR